MVNFRPNNPHLITSSQAVAEEGYATVEEYLATEGLDSVILACCDQGCRTEPDGYCEHNCPSVIVAKGLI